MESDAEKLLAKTILDSFRKAYEEFAEARRVVGDAYTAAVPEDHAKRITLMALVAQYKVVVSAMNELHHSIGHTLFHDCWSETAVGEEFSGTSVLKQLMDTLELLGLGMDVTTLDIDEPIPPDLPEAVRNKIEEIRKARQMAPKSHLN